MNREYGMTLAIIGSLKVGPMKNMKGVSLFVLFGQNPTVTLNLSPRHETENEAGRFG